MSSTDDLSIEYNRSDEHGSGMESSENRKLPGRLVRNSETCTISMGSFQGRVQSLRHQCLLFGSPCKAYLLPVPSVLSLGKKPPHRIETEGCHQARLA